MNIPHRVAASATCVATLLLLLASTPGRALSLTISEPDGVGDRIAAGRDYATEMLGDPWDMNDATDINLVESSGITGASYSGGVFSATAADNDPTLFLLDPGIASSQRLGKTGKYFPIDTTTYRVLLGSDERERRELVPGDLVHGRARDAGRRLGVHPDARPAGAFTRSTLRRSESSAAPWARGRRSRPRACGSIRPTVSGSTFQIDWAASRRQAMPRRASPRRFRQAIPARTPWSTSISTTTQNPANGFIGPFDATSARGHGYVGCGTACDIRSGKLLRRRPRLSRDYAGLDLENPWDMSDAADITFSAASRRPSSRAVCSPGRRIRPTRLRTARTADGADIIDASIFKSCPFQMTLSSSHLNTRSSGRGPTAGTVFSTSFIASSGSNIYTVDLGAPAEWHGRCGSSDRSRDGIWSKSSVDWVSLNTGPGAVSAVADRRDGRELGTPDDRHSADRSAPAARRDGRARLRILHQNNPWNMAEASDIELTTGLAATSRSS